MHIPSIVYRLNGSATVCFFKSSQLFHDIPSTYTQLPVPEELSGFVYLSPHDESKVIFPISTPKISLVLHELKQTNLLYTDVKIDLSHIQQQIPCDNDHSSVIPNDYINQTDSDAIFNSEIPLPIFTLPKTTGTPVNMFTTKHLEEMSFPGLFPQGKGGFSSQHQLTLTQYIQTRL